MTTYIRVIDNRDGHVRKPDGNPADSWLREHRSDERVLGLAAYTEATADENPYAKNREWFVVSERRWVVAMAEEYLAREVASETEPDVVRELLGLPVDALDEETAKALASVNSDAITDLRSSARVRSVRKTDENDLAAARDEERKVRLDG